jgi:hypothetical protein
MTQFYWNAEKNRVLKNNPDRAVCFEDVVTAIESGGLLDDVEHMNSDKYPNQRMYVVLHNSYVFGVPYVQDKDGVFLKTIYPSRKLTAEYFKGEDHDA